MQQSPELCWFGDHGFYPVDPRGVYNLAYFKKYEGYAQTPMGKKILEARLTLVELFLGPESPLVDVGIGSGQFVEARQGCRGYDVNPAGILWLRKRGLYVDPYRDDCANMTFWDSLEHMEDPAQVLLHCQELAFICLPIFEDREHVLCSRHFRPDEHFWYWTRAGFISYMGRQGFRQEFHGTPEVVLGREGIETFVFRRVGSAA